MNEHHDDEEFAKATAYFAEEVRKTAKSMKILQSAFLVLGFEMREFIEAINTELETPAKEIGECAVARAKRIR